MLAAIESLVVNGGLGGLQRVNYGWIELDRMACNLNDLFGQFEGRSEMERFHTKFETAVSNSYELRDAKISILKRSIRKG